MEYFQDMSNLNISYSSVSQAIDDAIAKYKKNESIEDCLLWINSDEDSDENRLTCYAYETDTFFNENEDFVFLISAEKFFYTDDDIFDYFDTKELDLKENADILDFMKNRIDSLSDEYPVATHSHHRDGLYLTANCEIWGQAGPHWSSFNIHSSKEEFYKYLAGQGYIFWSNETFLSHSETDLILMFKRNITNKYFGG